MKIQVKKIILDHQQQIILAIGYVLVFIIGLSLGRVALSKPAPPDIKIEEAFAPLNNTENLAPAQSDRPAGGPPPPAATQGLDCTGKIKGNIGSGGTKIYHMPGGSFYNRTTPELCFDTEAEAQAAGFRKSSK